MKIEIKSIFGELIFKYECENNTIKKTVEEAIKGKVSLYLADLRSADLRSADLYLTDLRSADLRSADLSSANLRSANLSSANLYLANLRSADLSSADLSSANLRSADLRSANLRSANLRSANLSSANLYLALNKETANIPIFCKWNHSIKDNKIKIGCKIQTIEDWDKFFESDEVYETKRNTEEFKQIQAVYLAYKSYLTHLKK